MKNTIKWICGIILVAIGIGSLFSSVLTGIIYLLTGAFLLPPLLATAEEKLNVKISTAVWICILPTRPKLRFEKNLPRRLQVIQLEACW
jgi:hypothetical protein